MLVLETPTTNINAGATEHETMHEDPTPRQLYHTLEDVSL